MGGQKGYLKVLNGDINCPKEYLDALQFLKFFSMFIGSISCNTFKRAPTKILSAFNEKRLKKTCLKLCLLTQFHVIRPKKLPPKLYQLLIKKD